MTWKDPKVEEPPKDRPFLCKSNGFFYRDMPYKVLFFMDAFKDKPHCFYNEDSHHFFKIDDIEKWCEIPQ